MAKDSGDTVEVFNKATGVHVSVSPETWARMTQGDYAPATDESRQATREAATSAVSSAASAANADTAPRAAAKKTAPAKKATAPAKTETPSSGDLV
jgi:hypothetical protein